MTATVTIASGATWQEVAADRQGHRDATIAAVQPPIPHIKEVPQNTTSLAKQVLSKEEVKITETLVEDLAPRLAKGELSSTVVIKAFLRRAALAQIATNCITELLPDKALSRATFLDEYLQKNGKTIGPLHGIPISVKEHIGMKGLDLNGGFVGWVGTVAEKDAYILELLWNAGAVFYARTTQPQTLMHLETSSNLYGTTTNPFNSNLTAGGSSGGEGALVGFRGSCLGIGTDIGGSIRSPAANNGVYGVKPTVGRLPFSGYTATMAGSEHILPTIGPLSTSLAGCKLFIKAILAAQPWHHEPNVFPFPWKEEDFFKERKVKVAVMWDDGVVKVHPPIRKAMERVVESMKHSEKFEVTEWVPWRHDEAWEIIANLYFADGALEEKNAISMSGEPTLPLSTHILDNKFVEPHSISTLWQSTVRRNNYREAYAKKWNETATSIGPDGELEGMVDVILCPAGPGVAPRIGTAKWWGYTSQWNILDYPAVVFPVDQVAVSSEAQGNAELADEKHETRNDRDRENWKLWEDLGEEGYRDAPISLQLVGRRFEDEKMLQALEIMNEEVGVPFTQYV